MTRFDMARHARFVALLLLALAAATPFAAAGDLTDAQAIVDRFVEVTGSDQVLGKHTSMTTSGTFSLPAQGISGTLTLQASAPNKLAMTVEIPGFGTMRSGYDGEVGWSMDPAMGAQILIDKPLAQAKDQANFYAMLFRPEDLDTLEFLGEEEFDGQVCYKLKGITVNAVESTYFFAKDSGFLVGMAQSQHTPMGEIPVQSSLQDYKEFGGMKIATKTVQTTMGMQQIVSIESIDFAPIDDSAFALPPEIAALTAGSTTE